MFESKDKQLGGLAQYVKAEERKRSVLATIEENEPISRGRGDENIYKSAEPHL
jgi:hypothetical protein